jgi:hypothetical protein
MNETGSGPWQDFGQKVDLTARIREILINYPEGTSILKELVQVCMSIMRLRSREHI